MSDIIIEAKDLTKDFAKTRAVDNIDFILKRGECLGMLGPNGAGKTTTLRMILGLTEPSSGDLTVLSHALPKEARPLRARVGVVPQQDNLDRDFTVYENLVSYASYFGLPSRRIQERIEKLLEFAALENRRDERVTNLSGGMQRRLILARALINEPDILILDEPTTGLDPQARQLIWAKLRQIQKEGTTLILTTHYLEEAERLCDRIIIIDHGRVLAEGSPRALIKKHIPPQVVEVRGPGHDTVYHTRHDFPNIKMDLLGETLFCYGDSMQAMLGYLQQYPELDYLHRPANLEDVFLKLTGRELRDG